MEQIGIYLEYLFQLIYPNLCLACEQHPKAKDQLCCTTCMSKLYYTELHLQKENTFTQHFWGRVEIESAASFLYYSKESPAQKLIQKLKYNKKSNIGVKLGEEHGELLKESPFFKNIDLIIPVPLHPKKEYQRGYNQSWMYAKGLAKAMKKPLSNKHLHRVKNTQTQTKKSRMERVQNTNDAFTLTNADALIGKHLLIVDDVMTTGATLEACALKLQVVENIKISLATLAIAK